ncbi:hypothetical protein PVAP13_2NG249800 [Panicum virgatum]|uniref:Uncharacterized protein n=1 Tax=Panicum virgatum TaxID=38727 RepID=A0A8T0VHP4_PANVG|nr:hypothetical protein PVAP13_2NG249800 [Panicum virgatum]
MWQRPWRHTSWRRDVRRARRRGPCHIASALCASFILPRCARRRRRHLRPPLVGRPTPPLPRAGHACTRESRDLRLQPSSWLAPVARGLLSRLRPPPALPPLPPRRHHLTEASTAPPPSPCAQVGRHSPSSPPPRMQPCLCISARL